MALVHSKHAVIINKYIAGISHPEHGLSCHRGVAGKGFEGGLKKVAQGIQGKTFNMNISFGDNVGSNAQGLKVYGDRGTVNRAEQGKGP